MTSAQASVASAPHSYSQLSPSAHSMPSLATSPDSVLPPITPEYLQELLKDKRNLQNFPTVFHHVDRILEMEISRARSALYHQNGSTRHHANELPEGEGPVVTVQEKVYIPVKDNPNYNFVGRLLGPRGMTAKQLESDLDCKIMVRGKGSMRDKKKEEQNRGKPNWEHLADELHVLICVEDHQNRADIKAKRAAEEISAFLEQAVKMPESEDRLKQMQLMEVAALNEASRASNAAAALSMAASVAPSMSSLQQLPPAAAAALLRLPPAAAAAAAAGLPFHQPHLLLPPMPGQQQQHQLFGGFPIVQQQPQQQQQQQPHQPAGLAGDLQSYLMAAAAAAAGAPSASSAATGGVPTSAAGAAAADPASVMAGLVAAGLYPGLEFAGQQQQSAGPMKSRQGTGAALRSHPYSRSTL